MKRGDTGWKRKHHVDVQTMPEVGNSTPPTVTRPHLYVVTVEKSARDGKRLVLRFVTSAASPEEAVGKVRPTEDYTGAEWSAALWVSPYLPLPAEVL